MCFVVIVIVIVVVIAMLVIAIEPPSILRNLSKSYDSCMSIWTGSVRIRFLS